MKIYEDFISTKEVAKITGYNIHTIREFARTGKLKMYRPGPESHMRFKRSEIEQFIKRSNPEKTLFEILQEIRQVWLKVKYKVSQQEKDRLLELQGISLKSHLAMLKKLDKKYNDD